MHSVVLSAGLAGGRPHIALTYNLLLYILQQKHQTQTFTDKVLTERT